MLVFSSNSLKDVIQTYRQQWDIVHLVERRYSTSAKAEEYEDIKSRMYNLVIAYYKGNNRDSAL